MKVIIDQIRDLTAAIVEVLLYFQVNQGLLLIQEQLAQVIKELHTIDLQTAVMALVRVLQDRMTADLLQDLQVVMIVVRQEVHPIIVLHLLVAHHQEAEAVLLHQVEVHHQAEVHQVEVHHVALLEVINKVKRTAFLYSPLIN